MSIFSKAASLWKSIFQRGSKQQSLNDELQSYIDLAADQYEREGMPPAEARRRAVAETGGVERTKEQVRDRWIGNGIAIVGRDLSYAWRSLRRSPTFTIVVAVTLAIGIGANAAVLSVIDAGFFRKLPVPDPEHVIEIFGDDTPYARRAIRDGNSFPDYLDLRQRVSGVQGLAAYSMSTLTLGDELSGSDAWSAFVTGNYFPLLGVHPERGRFIGVGEDEGIGAHAVAVISYTMWKERFGGDTAIVGRALAIGTGRFTIVGVAPHGFTGTHPEGRTDLWLPYTMQGEATGADYTFDRRDNRRAMIVGRLERGSSVARVQASAERALNDLKARYPATDALLRLRVMQHDRLVSVEHSPDAFASAALIWVMVVLIHLVACSNIATLMLARVSSRQRELGVRLCLGASRRRIVLQSLAEPALIAAIGAGGGLFVARWLSSLITSMQFMSAMDPGLSVRVVIIVVVVTAATVAEFGLLPAREASRRDPLTLLRGGSGARIAGKRDRTGAILVCAQVAVSLVLMSNAVVMMRTFQKQAHAELGFDAAHTVVADVRWRKGYRPTGDWNSALTDIFARTSSIPGVQAVTVAMTIPLRPLSAPVAIDVAGHQYAEGESHAMSAQSVGPGYFKAIGASLAFGREFGANDRAASASGPYRLDVAVVNESFARHYWPGENPLGRQLSIANRGEAIVVGVVRDMHDYVISTIVPRVYFPLLEGPVHSGFSLIARVNADPATALAGLRTAVLASGLPLDPPALRTMSDVVDDALLNSRIASIAVGICAAIAVLLTAAGLYGLVATWGAERRTEIGIRLALGAQVRQIHTLLLRGVARLVAIGVVAGGAGAFALVRVERASWGPSISIEALPLLLGALLLATIAGLATVIPAWRATSVDPAESLNAS